MYDMDQIGLPGSQNLLKEQLAVSGLEMQWLGAVGAVVSAGIGMFGANSAQDSKNKGVKASYEASKEQWRYQNEQAERDIEFQREQNQLQRQFNLSNAIVQDNAAVKNWQMQIDQQFFDYGLRKEAKAKSDMIMNAQLEHNRNATELAMEQHENWFKDRQIEKDFALGEQDIIMDKATDDMSAAFSEILMNRQQEAVGLEGKLTQVQHKRNYDKGMLTMQNQENIIDGLINAGAAQNRQAGRSTDKGIQAAQMKAGMKTATYDFQAEAVFKMAGLSIIGVQQDLIMNNQRAERLREQVGADYINKSDMSYHKKKEAVASYNSAVRQSNVDAKKIQLDARQADLQAYANNMPTPKFGPQPAPPFSTPLPQILDPYDHVWSPEPVKGASYSGAGISSIASSLPSILTGISNWNKPFIK